MDRFLSITGRAAITARTGGLAAANHRIDARIAAAAADAAGLDPVGANAIGQDKTGRTDIGPARNRDFPGIAPGFTRAPNTDTDRRAVFGPDSRDAASVAQVVNLAALSFGLCQEAWCLVGDPGPHETGWLALETAKARHALNILPRWSLPQAIEQTMCWYRDWYQGADARDLCEQQIRAYEAQL